MTDTLNKPETARRALSILLVEDEAATLSALATLLSRRGHAVTTARDVHEALEQCGHDVVVTDLMLPSGKGLEVLAHMKSRGERPHAVVTTGTPSIDSCREAFKLGAVEFLQKPFRMEELVRAVEAMRGVSNPAQLQEYASALAPMGQVGLKMFQSFVESGMKAATGKKSTD